MLTGLDNETIFSQADIGLLHCRLHLASDAGSWYTDFAATAACVGTAIAGGATMHILVEDQETDFAGSCNQKDHDQKCSGDRAR